MNHFVVSAALASLSSFVAAVCLWLKGSARPANRLGGLYWFSIAFWASFVGSQPHSITMLSPFWWGWLLHLGCTFIPVLLFHYTIVLTNQRSQALRVALKLSYLLTTVFNLLNLVTSTFTHGMAYRDTYAYPVPSFVFPVYFILFVALVIWSTALMVRYLPSVPSPERSAFKFLLITHVFAYLGGIDNFLIMVDIRLFPLYPYGLYMIPLYALAAISVAAQRRAPILSTSPT